jgi:ribosomal protein L11 methyltransferase
MPHPFPIGTRFRIRTPEDTASPTDRIDLVLAKGAFGSGEHETTASCLETMENLSEVRGARVLDVGSGTGILSIGALKLGAARAVCLDIDPQAVQTARLNCDLNGVGDRAEHVAGVLSNITESGFDLVLANIYGDLLLELAGEIVARGRPGALMLLSGILWEYNFEVRRAFETLGCTVVKNHMLPQFSTVLLRNRPEGA